MSNEALFFVSIGNESIMTLRRADGVGDPIHIDVKETMNVPAINKLRSAIADMTLEAELVTDNKFIPPFKPQSDFGKSIGKVYDKGSNTGCPCGGNCRCSKAV